MEKPKVIIGADHGGFKLKEELKPFLKQLGYDFEDVGTFSEESVDYPDYAIKVSEIVGKAETQKPLQKFPPAFGILLCRSAAGMMIAANKIRGVRAVAAFDETSAKHSREHNAANVLGLSGDWLDSKKAKNIVNAWLITPFPGEDRHKKRLQKILELEKRVYK
jgi:ribose 5-phosphate isomerase B